MSDTAEAMKEMIGKVFVSVTAAGALGRRQDELTFVAADGTTYIFNHHQDCCEGVGIESIVGDLDDLVGEPLLVAEESTSRQLEVVLPEDDEARWDDSTTWTFYKFATRKGWVDVRWYGTSNGYYSEAVDLDIIRGDKQ